MIPDRQPLTYEHVLGAIVITSLAGPSPLSFRIPAK